jgi:hypothetical protein
LGRGDAGRPIAWARIEDEIAVGRIKGHAIVLRGILLPLGSPPD